MPASSRVRFVLSRLLPVVAGILLTVAAARSLTADDADDAPRVDSPAAGPRVALFDGSDLDSFHITGCEVAIRDKNLVLRSGDGLVRSEHTYRDFILELKWRPRRDENWDSGIYFRCPNPPANRPWPRRYQINLKQHQEGTLIGFKNARVKDLAKPGQWNHLKLTVRGSSAQLEINGKAAWSVDGIEPAEGYIGLQSEVAGGGQFEFRDIHVTELGYRPLFNAKDLSGWEGAGSDAAKCWEVRDGLLLCTGKKGPWLRSREEFGDFNLRLQYLLKDGGNSGVYVRVPANGSHHGKGAGVEVQILHDQAERYKSLKPYQYCGSVYKIAAATKHVGRPAGRWNSLEIECRGADYRVIHNGIVIVDARIADFPELAERRRSGFLGLQNHSEEVRFRNIRIHAEPKSTQ